MVGRRNLSRGWSRLRSAWSRNDGKAKEEWATGLDLKEAVLIGLLVIVVIALVALAAFELVERL